MPIVLIASRQEAEVEAMLSDAPGEVEVRLLPFGESIPTNVGKRVGKASDLASHLSGVEIIFGMVREADFRLAHDLKWIQQPSIGVEGHMYTALKESEVILTNCKGLGSTQLSEQVFAMLSSLTRRIREQHDFMKTQHWERVDCVELAGATMGLIGLGAVGKAMAVRASAFGFRVLAVDPEPIEKPDHVERLEKPEWLGEMAAQCDVLVSCCPFTPESHRIVSGDVIGRMKPTSYFINVSRGKVVDEEALIVALQAKRLAGAGLDVTYVEPCPPDNPLWGLENVIPTSHSAGSSPFVRPRAMQLFIDNLHRYVNGEPLQNVVDKQKGY